MGELNVLPEHWRGSIPKIDEIVVGMTLDSQFLRAAVVWRPEPEVRPPVVIGTVHAPIGDAFPRGQTVVPEKLKSHVETLLRGVTALIARHERGPATRLRYVLGVRGPYVRFLPEWPTDLAPAERIRCEPEKFFEGMYPLPADRLWGGWEVPQSEERTMWMNRATIARAQLHAILRAFHARGIAIDVVEPTALAHRRLHTHRHAQPSGIVWYLDVGADVATFSKLRDLTLLQQQEISTDAPGVLGARAWSMALSALPTQPETRHPLVLMGAVIAKLRSDVRSHLNIPSNDLGHLAFRCACDEPTGVTEFGAAIGHALRTDFATHGANIEPTPWEERTLPLPQREAARSRREVQEHRPVGGCSVHALIAHQDTRAQQIGQAFARGQYTRLANLRRQYDLDGVVPPMKLAAIDRFANPDFDAAQTLAQMELINNPGIATVDDLERAATPRPSPPEVSQRDVPPPEVRKMEAQRYRPSSFELSALLEAFAYLCEQTDEVRVRAVSVQFLRDFVRDPAWDTRDAFRGALERMAVVCEQKTDTNKSGWLPAVLEVLELPAAVELVLQYASERPGVSAEQLHIAARYVRTGSSAEHAPGWWSVQLEQVFAGLEKKT
ncbi:hypothetical protein HY632_05145 [Candidatus Uhrbacteria bacterium]|nr:hypothetical protein [Candidatus Uhrbacteria bacterium]